MNSNNKFLLVPVNVRMLKSETAADVIVYIGSYILLIRFESFTLITISAYS